MRENNGEEETWDANLQWHGIPCDCWKLDKKWSTCCKRIFDPLMLVITRKRSFWSDGHLGWRFNLHGGSEDPGDFFLHCSQEIQNFQVILFGPTFAHLHTRADMIPKDTGPSRTVQWFRKAWRWHWWSQVIHTCTWNECLNFEHASLFWLSHFRSLWKLLFFVGLSFFCWIPCLRQFPFFCISHPSSLRLRSASWRW